jgi:hypothetical protein
MIQQRKILEHPDLQIELITNAKGKDVFMGRSRRYEPFEAAADTAIDCFFKFDIQLAEQKLIAALIR